MTPSILEVSVKKVTLEQKVGQRGEPHRVVQIVLLTSIDDNDEVATLVALQSCVSVRAEFTAITAARPSRDGLDPDLADQLG
jgi:hypothetical protein